MTNDHRLTALLGRVTPNLRAVLLSWSDTEIHFDAYFCGEVTDTESELMGDVEADLGGYFNQEGVDSFSHTLKRLDYPARLPRPTVTTNCEWVYEQHYEYPEDPDRIANMPWDPATGPDGPPGPKGR